MAIFEPEASPEAWDLVYGGKGKIKEEADCFSLVQERGQTVSEKAKEMRFQIRLLPLETLRAGDQAPSGFGRMDLKPRTSSPTMPVKFQASSSSLSPPPTKKGSKRKLHAGPTDEFQQVSLPTFVDRYRVEGIGYGGDVFYQPDVALLPRLQWSRLM